VIVRHKERTCAYDRHTIRREHGRRPDRAHVAHVFLSASHLKDVDGAVVADDGGIDVVVERADRWPLIDEVKVNGISIQDLGVKAKKIEGVISIGACITDRFDSTEVEQAVYTRVVDVQCNQF